MIQAGGTFVLTLVVIGVLFSVVSLYYYARIVGAMFLVRPQEEEPAPKLANPEVQIGSIPIPGLMRDAYSAAGVGGPLRNSGISIKPAPCAEAITNDQRVRSRNPTFIPTQFG